MSDYKFWDDDIQSIKNNAYIGNEDTYEIRFNVESTALNIHKDDVIHLANLFGLVVYEKGSALPHTKRKESKLKKA